MATVVEGLESVRAAVRAVARTAYVPSSLYRLQLGRSFTFRDALRIVPYLKELEVGGVYLSPCFKAVPGSPHGYDVTDPNSLNPELGSEGDFDALCGALKEARLGVVLDIVPNHMGIAGDANPYWTDVLRRGRASRYAYLFDIDWRPVKRELRDKILLPVLADLYGKVLEAGELRLALLDGALWVTYKGLRLPLSPKSCEAVLAQGAAGTDITERLAAFNGRPRDPASFDLLHQLLESQAYRLAHWRVATDEINYRRFFNINELAALRMEDERVFDFCHRLVFRLLARGKVQGLRIDHADGLYDPPEYLRRLQERHLRAELGRRGVRGPALEAALAEEEFKACAPLFVVVEKVLDRKEELPGDWRVHGTVGYEFLNALNGVFIDRDNEAAIGAVCEEFIGRKKDFERLRYEAKKLSLEDAMAAEIEALGHRLDSISEASRSYRDFTRRSLTEALREVIACFPVYRTYIGSAGGVSETDERTIRIAVEKAKSANPSMRRGVFDFIRDVLLLKLEEILPDDQHPRYRDFVLRFQQLTAPVMAKGSEDTAFYMDHRLISLNEVGGDPGHFGLAVGDFHRQNAQRCLSWPRGLVTTSTHDTKRSEDVRMRLDALSELPEEWRTRVLRWAVLNEKHKTLIDGALEPARDTEFLIYQTLLGAWPGTGPLAAGREDFVRRMRAYLRKSVREAKVRTDWADPDVEYEEAVGRFVTALLDDSGDNAFLKDFLPFQERISGLGMLNSLSALALKIASPGVMDTYQGTESWDFSLVDPDNRRPVDFASRAGRLAELDALRTAAGQAGAALRASGNPLGELAARLLASKEDGRVKLLLLRQGLRERKIAPGLFIGADYLPVKAAGPKESHVIAFLRRAGERWLLAAAGRFFSRLPSPPVGEAAWSGTTIALPESCKAKRFRDIFTDARIEVSKQDGVPVLPASRLFARLSAAVLIGEERG